MQLDQSAGPPGVLGCILLVPPGVCPVGSPAGVLHVGLIVEGHAVSKLTLVLEVQLPNGLVLVQRREDNSKQITRSSWFWILFYQLFKALNLEANQTRLLIY